VLEAVESVPAILIALFCYAPVSGYLASHAESSSQRCRSSCSSYGDRGRPARSVRGITIPLGELYYRKYSLSFRSYGFRKSRILRILLRTRTMRGAVLRAVAGILLKTLVLDTSFGFIVQLGFGSYGMPAHLSPGALIAANRDALFPGGSPGLFWLPSLAIAAISLALVLALGERKEAAE
jgi:small-conductance mechanosensitive channel